MESFSPVTRQVLAVGLLVLTCLIGARWILLPLINAIEERREELTDLRSRAAHLTAIANQPLPGMSQLPARTTIKAAARGPALLRLESAIAVAATVAGVHLQQNLIAPSSSAQQKLTIAFAVSGSEEALTHFVGLLEHGEPIVKFESWQLRAGATADQPLMLAGHATAAWERQQ